MIYTYDPKLLLVTFGGIPLTGFADGTFLAVVRNSDMFSEVTGADGETSRAKSNDRSGLATITLKQTSPSNDVLSAFALADEEANAGVRTFMAKDALGTSIFFSAFAYVKKIPDSAFGKEINNREWSLFLSDLRVLVGGNVPQI